MYDNDSKGISYIAGFWMLIAFTIAGVILASILSIPVWTSMTDKGVFEMEKYMLQPAYSNAIKIIQIITAIVGFLFPAILTAYLLNRKPFNLLGFSGSINWRQVGLVAAIVITALIVSGFLSYINDKIPISSNWRIRFDKMEKDYLDQVKTIVGLNNIGQLLVSLFIMAFLPALCEEALFRGGLQNLLSRSIRNHWVAIIIVSIIFSAVHFSYFGFLSRLFLGIVLGLIYQYSGKLWLSILAHFLNNAMAITALYVYKMQGKPIEDAMGDTSGATFWGLLALPVLIGLLYLFRNIHPKKIEVPVDPRREELRNTPFY